MKLIDISTPKYPNTFCKVDDEDFDFLNQWKWNSQVGKYTTYVGRVFRVPYENYPRLSKVSLVAMHREVMKCPKHKMVDHIDHNGLNNQKSNLRICTRAQNRQNSRKVTKTHSSKYKGVCWAKSKNNWRAQIVIPKRIQYLGYFSDEKEAALAYNKAAKQFFGKFACINDDVEPDKKS